MHLVSTHSAQIPALGLGTYTLNGDVARRMVEFALSIGYRHIDTAQMYANEREIGDILSTTKIAREALFITTKIWPNRFANGDLQRSVEESLSKLQISQVDLLLLHWPNPKIALAETIKALNEVKRDGMTKHIGISNFNCALIEQATALSSEPLLLNQIEYHPFLDQHKVLQALRKHDMALTAYSPLAKGAVFNNALLSELAAKYNKNPGQIALRWLLQQDRVIAIPRSSSEHNAQANLAIFDFNLSTDELQRISALAHSAGRLIDPAGMAPDWD